MKNEFSYTLEEKLRSFQINDDEVPDDGKNDDDASEIKKESSQRYIKKREEDVVDYISAGERVGREMRYVAETTEGERIGDWSPSPTGMRTTRLHKYPGTSLLFVDPSWLRLERSRMIDHRRSTFLHGAEY